MSMTQSHKRATWRSAQQGVSLIIALLCLIALTLAGLALIRSTDTTNVISGNLAFRQAALHATDVGVETAFDEIDTIAATVFLDKKYPNLCATGACNYYPTRQATDSAGIPTVINWALVPSTTVDNSYTVQYVLDRLCDAPLPVTDVRTQCMNTGAALVGSKKAGVEPLSKPVQVYYRATVRVVGPRNTESIVQALYAH